MFQPWMSASYQINVISKSYFLLESKTLFKTLEYRWYYINKYDELLNTKVIPQFSVKMQKNPTWINFIQNHTLAVL